MLLRSPTEMESWSARSTAPYQMLAPALTVTRPMSTAPEATKTGFADDGTVEEDQRSTAVTTAGPGPPALIRRLLVQQTQHRGTLLCQAQAVPRRGHLRQARADLPGRHRRRLDQHLALRSRPMIHYALARVLFGADLGQLMWTRLRIGALVPRALRQRVS